jgi:phenylalanyl-tRNA synthetase alpha chain
MQLPDSQVAVLEAASATEEQTIDRVSAETGLDPATVTGAAFDLEDAGLVTVSERVEESVELTDEGRRYHADELPEVTLHRGALAGAGQGDPGVDIGRAVAESGLEDRANIALSNYERSGYGTVADGVVVPDEVDPGTDEVTAALDAVAAGDVPDDTLLDLLERRDLAVRRERTVRSVTLTDEGVTALMEGVETAETVDRLTPEMLTSGEWRDAEFTAYNVAADAPAKRGGTVHILRQTAERVKDTLVGMGFREMDGPHADAEFWINDCLFMPQDHPARTHWDQFALDVPPMRDIPEDLLDRVRSAHLSGVGDDGDGYHSPWTEAVARGVDLRGHTTSLSMRYLSGHEVGDLDPPERFFSVEKVYRNDTLDPTHLLEFFQIEGWVMAEDLSVRDLMGTFEEFYQQFGITDLRFKPHYNPYTEPSFELFGTHPETGELIEIGNSGMFREEVLRPLGVDCDVMAWGLALERLLMLMYGFDDIRDVHGTLCDLDRLRNTEVLH